MVEPLSVFRSRVCAFCGKGLSRSKGGCFSYVLHCGGKAEPGYYHVSCFAKAKKEADNGDC